MRIHRGKPVSMHEQGISLEPHPGQASLVEGPVLIDPPQTDPAHEVFLEQTVSETGRYRAILNNVFKRLVDRN